MQEGHSQGTVLGEEGSDIVNGHGGIIPFHESSESRPDCPWCQLEAALERVGAAEQERDRAIAHDRQPYPTAWAYEQVCKARDKWQGRAEAAEKERDELRAKYEVGGEARFIVKHSHSYGDGGPSHAEHHEQVNKYEAELARLTTRYQELKEAANKAYEDIPHDLPHVQCEACEEFPAVAALRALTEENPSE